MLWRVLEREKTSFISFRRETICDALAQTGVHIVKIC